MEIRRSIIDCAVPSPGMGGKPQYLCHLQLEKARKSRSAYWRAGGGGGGGGNHHMPSENRWNDLIGLFHLKLLQCGLCAWGPELLE